MSLLEAEEFFLSLKLASDKHLTYTLQYRIHNNKEAKK